jgi:hypothetical protein
MRAANLILAIAFAMSSSAFAADPSARFPNEQISLADWQAYLDEVKLISDVHCDVTPKNELYCLSDSRGSVWVFTIDGHPAHPAVVTGVMVTAPHGGSGMLLRAYYGGNESAFRAWQGLALGYRPIFREWDHRYLVPQRGQ